MAFLLDGKTMDIYRRRAGMLAGVDAFMQTGRALGGKAGQMSLFDVCDTENTNCDEYIVGDISVSENDVINAIRGEKEAVGEYLLFDPLQFYRDKILKYSTATSANAFELPDGEKVTLGGRIKRIDKKTTKHDKPIVFLTLLDFHDDIECILFERNIEKYQKLLKIDNIVFIKGAVSRRSLITNILINEIIDAGKMGTEKTSVHSAPKHTNPNTELEISNASLVL